MQNNQQNNQQKNQASQPTKKGSKTPEKPQAEIWKEEEEARVAAIQRHAEEI
jgi:hypothetical protein